MCLVAYLFVSGNIYSAKKSEITTLAISYVLIERADTLSSVAVAGYLFFKGKFMYNVEVPTHLKGFIALNTIFTLL